MLVVDDLVKTFDGSGRRARSADDTRVLAVDGVSFDVQDGELFTLLGPSGCGKTTTLRSIAGLERPDGGHIALGDRVFFDGKRKINTPANSRRLGMVFQSYAIWPHMSVFDNAAFPVTVLPRGRRPSRTQLRERVMRVLEVTDLAAMADRAATKLSGGQQQRLALARALVGEPDLMLLDEPLSNLDAKLREAMRFELKRLQRELGLTAIYVTHDQAEALAMSSRIAVVNEGKIVQVGKPREIYERPASEFVATFVGVTNLLRGTVAAVDAADGSCRVDTPDLSVWGVMTGSPLQVGDDAAVSIRPECVQLDADTDGARADGSSGVRNEFSGEVGTRAFLGDSVDHVIAVGKQEIRNRSNPAQSIAPGNRVVLRIDHTRVAVIPPADQKTAAAGAAATETPGDAG
ncbi:ABC transporter ATP-binding protein [Actinoallomurus oryzae]|uniref:ABC transporter ATP-binding protein n=1 Tax=Actinoallomurus oryzae TaxID=502180 RepID=A0ABP8R5Y7_9ACTN